MGKRSILIGVVSTIVVLLPSAALACGGLVSPNGTVNLLRTTTLAAYHDGIEHYFTAFEFTGAGGAKFGSIVPLPGKPTKITRAGDWTLQRLVREVEPPVLAFAATADSARSEKKAEVVLETTVDALDITVVRGGAEGVALWATDEGFELSPDAPEVLDFYAQRSKYFMAVAFDPSRARARNQQAGDSTPLHIRIPTDEPWVPLRILALGRLGVELVEADVFLLTPKAPSLLPAPVGAGSDAGLPVARGLFVERSERASATLVRDLRSDKGMGWMPRERMWLTYLRLSAPAAQLGYDLAIDPSGEGTPSWRAAGFPEGIGGPRRGPVRGPSVRVVPSPVEVAVAQPVRVDRSGWIVASIVLAMIGARSIWRRVAMG